MNGGIQYTNDVEVKIEDFLKAFTRFTAPGPEPSNYRLEFVDLIWNLMTTCFLCEAGIITREIDRVANAGYSGDPGDPGGLRVPRGSSGRDRCREGLLRHVINSNDLGALVTLLNDIKGIIGRAGSTTGSIKIGAMKLIAKGIGASERFFPGLPGDLLNGGYISARLSALKEILQFLLNIEFCIDEPAKTRGRACITPAIYEIMVECTFKSKAGKLRKTTRRKVKGAFFTPPAIARRLARDALGASDGCLNKDPARVVVLDPACGGGTLLMHSCDIIEEACQEKNLACNRRHIVEYQVHGYDTDALATRAALMRLWMWQACRHHQEQTPLASINVLGQNLKNKSCLEGKIPRSFDVIVSNPPWSTKISIGENISLDVLDGIIQHLDIDPASININNFNMASVFVAWLLSKNFPVVSILLPKQFIKNKEYRTLRSLVKDRILKLGDFGQFPGVASECISLLWLGDNGKNRGIRRANIDWVKYDGLNCNAGTRGELNHGCIMSDFDDVINPDISCEFKELLFMIKGKGCILSDILGDGDLVERGIELGRTTSISRCSNPGCLKYFKISKKYYSKKTKEVTCPHCNASIDVFQPFIITSPEKSGIYAKKIIAGRHVHEWRIDPPPYLAYPLDGITEVNSKGHLWGDVDGNVRIVIKRIGRDLAAALLAPPDRTCWTFNTIYNIKVSPATLPGSILFQLNSRILKWYYELAYVAGTKISQQLTKEWLVHKLPFVPGLACLDTVGLTIHFLANIHSPGDFPGIDARIKFFLDLGNAILYAWYLDRDVFSRLDEKLTCTGVSARVHRLIRGDVTGEAEDVISAFYNKLSNDEELTGGLEQIYNNKSVRSIESFLVEKGKILL
ncbi:MAG: N-6 DNA methylase [Promethearchaeota archaeon]